MLAQVCEGPPAVLQFEGSLKEILDLLPAVHLCSSSELCVKTSNRHYDALACGMPLGLGLRPWKAESSLCCT
jgi:hypothetical protein